MKTKTLRLSAIGLACILLTGCSNKLDVIPTPADSVTYRSVPPWSYPPGTNDSAILSGMRVECDRFMASGADVQVLGTVFFVTLTSLSEAESLAQSSALQGGPISSVLLQTEGGAVGGVPVSQLTAASIANSIAEFGVPPNDTVSGIASMTAYGTVGSFCSLWSKSPQKVRGIAILGRVGSEVNNWYPISVGGPLR